MKKIKFYLKKLRRDLFNPLIYKVFEGDNKSRELNEYYLLFDEDELKAGGSQNFSFDDKGIPIIPTYIDIDEERMHYYPISIGQYGMAVFHTYLKDKSEKKTQRFMDIADWFVENQTEEGYWLADVPEPKFNLSRGWKSCMAQGRGINILLRAYQITGNESFLSASKRALETFEYHCDEGGICSSFNGNVYFEEYPSKPYPHVLNGMIFGLWGVYDYLRVFPDDVQARRIFDKAVSSLKVMLPEYDLGWWSSYDLYHKTKDENRLNPVTMHYQYIHIKQLEIMYAITNEEIFHDYAKKWTKYAKAILPKYRAYFGKFLSILSRY